MLKLSPCPQLVLKIIEVQDAPPMFALVDKNRNRLREWLGWLDKYNSVTDSEKSITESNKSYEDKKAFRFGIYFEERFAGVIELKSIDYVNLKSSIGYWLGEDFAGKGIMTQAVESVLRYAFEELILNKIELHIATGNLPSNKIAQRLGFKLDGVLRQSEWLYDHFVDHNVYSLLNSEWKALHAIT